MVDGGFHESRLGRVIPDDVWGILCIFAESRSEPYEGQVAVGNVIRNRTRRKFFSQGTVVSTVLAPYQFSWTNTADGQRTRVLSAMWEDPAFRSAARAWFESESNDLVGDCMFYHADYVHPYWAKAHGIVFVKQIGRHLFYRENGAA